MKRALGLLPIGLLFASCLDAPVATALLRRAGVTPASTGTPLILPLTSAEVPQRLAEKAAAAPAPAPAPVEAALVLLPEPPLELPAEEEWRELADTKDSPSEGSEELDLSVAPGEDVGAGDVLASIGRETWIFAEPRRKSRKVGYLKAGAIVKRAADADSFAGCKGGWYRIEPEGFVCRGKSVTFDVFHPVVEALRRRADRSGLPYDYVMSRAQTPVLYGRIPNEREQGVAEPDLKHHLRKHAGTQRDPSFVPLPEPGPVPPVLLYGQGAPGLVGDRPRSKDTLVVGKAGIRSGFALLSQFEEEGRRFGLTTELTVLPLDRTRWVKPSTFEGLKLEDGLTLPVGFVMKKRATRYEKNAEGRFVAGQALSYREAIALSGEASGAFLQAKDGSYVRAEDVRRVDPMTRRPTWATAGRKWVDVSLLRQALVAYEGDKPVFVTLVSTGAGGIGDPKETHATTQGVYLVHTKHVTTTMDGDEAGDEFDLRDVPFVQYFHEGYALHAAYWHDDFGTPRSHGCINLSPKDAAHLFGWTTPDVPEAWHAALSLKRGTVVYTHP